MSDKPQESPGQEESPEVGAPLDQSQQEQLADLLGEFAAPKAEREEKAAEEEVSDAEAFLNENPDRSKEVVDEIIEDVEISEPEAEAEPEAEVEIEEKEVELDPIAQLRLELAQMRELITGQKSEGEVEEETFDFTIDGGQFFTDEEIDDLYSNPKEVMSKLLARVYAKAREDTYRDIPALVESASARQLTLKEARAKFWNQNGDLLQVMRGNKNVEGLLRLTADQVQSENPAWPLEQIFEETGKRVRAALNLSQKAKEAESKAGNKTPPRKPRVKRRAPEGDTRSGLQKDIDDLISAV